MKKFFYHSFRPRNAEDYKKLFTRGFGKGGDINAEYPWFYLRVFAVLAAAYAIYAVINAAMPGAGDFETLYFVGGAFMDVALLVLLYELYPYNDLSLLAVAAVCVIGGSFADFISAFCYHFHSYETLSNGWKLAAIAGVSEEIAKAVPAIVCILLLKKKNSPLAGFLIGAAVGTWFSITENASYIHTYPYYLSILTATFRAFGCMFSHAPWTALICWAFCKFKKPLLNFKFYGVVLFCMATHFCIDMPLWDIVPVLFAEAAVCGLATFAFSAAVLFRERKPALADTAANVEITAFTPRHKADVTAGGFIAVLCALLIAFAAVFSTTSYERTVFNSAEEFKEFAHSGLIIAPDDFRKFDEEYDNYYAIYEEGVLTYASQRVPADGFMYEYRYSLTEPETDEEITEETEETEKVMRLMFTAIVTETDGEETVYLPYVHIYDEGDLTYYRINPEVESGSIKYVEGKYVLEMPVKRLSIPTIVLICVIAATAAGGVCTYVILRKKANKNNF